MEIEGDAARLDRVEAVEVDDIESNEVRVRYFSSGSKKMSFV